MRAAASALRHTRYADPAGRTIRAGLHIGHPWRASAAISYRPLWGPLQRCTYLQQLFRILCEHTQLGTLLLGYRKLSSCLARNRKHTYSSEQMGSSHF